MMNVDDRSVHRTKTVSVLYHLSVLSLLSCTSSAFLIPNSNLYFGGITRSIRYNNNIKNNDNNERRTATTLSQFTVTPKVTLLFGKKDKRKGGGGGGGKQQPQEKQSVKDARFDAMTRQFMFTLTGLTKVLPDKSKTILNNIYLSFYPGAKIGVVGLNGSGKSTLLKIMAGIDTEYDGLARPLPGISIGYLSQEPELPFATVQECVDDAVKSSQRIIDQYNDLSMKLADATLSEDEIQKIMSQTEELTNTIEAGT